MRLAHVAYTKQKTELIISLADDGVLTEQQSLSTFLRSRQLGEHEPCH